MRFSSNTTASLATYTKMSETPTTPPPVSPPTSPTSPTPAKEGENKTKKYEGEGQTFKAKLIGMEDLPIDRDEKVCLEAMFKLKAIVRARAEHKQRIQLNLTMSAVKVIDDTTKAQIASHEIERISFVVIDPRDNRAFGYIYNTPDDRHQFWAIKTERAAALSVIALRELFELAFEQYTNTEKAKEDANKTSTEQTVPKQEPSSPLASELPQTTPVSPPSASVSQTAASNTTTTPEEPDIWGDNSTSTVGQTNQKASADFLLDIDEPALPVVPPAPKAVDPLEELLGGFSTTTISQPPVSTGTNNALFDLFSNPAPPPSAPAPTPVANQFTNLYNQPPQPNLYNPVPTFPQQQQQQSFASSTSLPQQEQQDLLSPRPMSPVAPPTVTSPFADLDIFTGLSSGAAGGAKTTKESFFPSTAPKTVQQLLLEKQS